MRVEVCLLIFVSVASGLTASSWQVSWCDNIHSRDGEFSTGQAHNLSEFPTGFSQSIKLLVLVGVELAADEIHAQRAHPRPVYRHLPKSAVGA